MEPAGGRPDDLIVLAPVRAIDKAAMEPAGGRPDDLIVLAPVRAIDKAAMEPAGGRPDDSSPQKWLVSCVNVAACERLWSRCARDTSI
jgi:hypothetical protein